MPLLYLSPEDRRWARRRLKTTARIGMIFAVLGLVMRLSAGSLPTPGNVVRGSFATQHTPNMDVRKASEMVATENGQRFERSVASDTTNHRSFRQPTLGPPSPTLHAVASSIPPMGWRKTSHGWEHTSSWPGFGPTINDLIATQKLSEPQWFRASLAMVTSVPPITIALIQLVAIAAIAGVARLNQSPVRQWRPRSHAREPS